MTVHLNSLLKCVLCLYYVTVSGLGNLGSAALGAAAASAMTNHKGLGNDTIMQAYMQQLYPGASESHPSSRLLNPTSAFAHATSGQLMQASAVGVGASSPYLQLKQKEGGWCYIIWSIPAAISFVFSCPPPPPPSTITLYRTRGLQPIHLPSPKRCTGFRPHTNVCSVWVSHQRQGFHRQSHQPQQVFRFCQLRQPCIGTECHPGYERVPARYQTSQGPVEAAQRC